MRRGTKVLLLLNCSRLSTVCSSVSPACLQPICSQLPHFCYLWTVPLGKSFSHRSTLVFTLVERKDVELSIPSGAPWNKCVNDVHWLVLFWNWSWKRRKKTDCSTSSFTKAPRPSHPSSTPCFCYPQLLTAPQFYPWLSSKPLGISDSIPR